jgi:hypothetical protein
MSAAESARDARVTSTAARLLLLVLHAAAAEAGAGHLVTCTILGRMGHAAACLPLAVAAAADLEATKAIVCAAGQNKAAAEDGMQQAGDVTGTW